jgi:hypothetical protein
MTKQYIVFPMGTQPIGITAVRAEIVEDDTYHNGEKPDRGSIQFYGINDEVIGEFFLDELVGWCEHVEAPKVRQEPQEEGRRY